MSASNTTLNRSLLSDCIADPKWKRSFPANVAIYDDSLRFMKRAALLTFCSILKGRKMLPRECFEYMGISESVKCCTFDFNNPISAGVSQTLLDAFELMQNGFLKDISLVVSENEYAEYVMEVFSLKIHYDANGPSANLSSVTGTESIYTQLANLKYNGTLCVRDQLILLVRSINHLCNNILSPLPENCFFQFRINLTDNSEPHFSRKKFKIYNYFFKLDKECQTAVLGQMRPGFHACDLSCSSKFISDSYEAEMSLKNYADRVANKYGYEKANTLYQSFVSSDGNTSLNDSTSPSN